MSTQLSALRPLFLAVSMAAGLTACGGGGGSGGGSTSTPSAAPTPATDQSVSGAVIDGPLQGATVCVDLNANGVCDSGEPVSSATDAQGHYTISGLTAAQATGFPLVATVPATATDGGTAVGTAFVLQAPAGKGAVISPITTLIQAGIAQGQTASAAEAAAAIQLQVAASSLYLDYTATASADNTALTDFAHTIVTGLKAGHAPVLGVRNTTATPGYSVRQFTFGSASSYTLRYYYSDHVTDSNGLTTYYDERVGLSQGSVVASSTLYDSALYATASGWKSVDASTANTSTVGNPYISNYGYGYQYRNTSTSTDVSGMTVAAAVALTQDTTVNSFSSMVGVTASQLTGTMPAGAKVTRIVNEAIATPVGYRVSDGAVSNVGTLAALVTAYPVPTGTATGSNTVSMGNLHGSAACGATSCPQERVRAAFAANSKVYVYLCDLNTTTNSSTNCTLQAITSTYSLGTAADGSTPIMTFASLPAAIDAKADTRVFVASGGHVYYGWQDKLSAETNVQTRLNDVAFAVVAQQLGITPPAAAATSPYAGTWSASYSGSDTGSCAAIVIDVAGRLSGSCTSTGLGGSFTASGTVSSTGTASFTASGLTSSGVTFSGSFTTTSGAGSWSGTGLSGQWTATRQ